MKDLNNIQIKIRIFGKNLQYLRQNSGETQNQISKNLGISRQTISAIEKGRAKPNMVTMCQISDYYGFPLENMFMEMDKKYCVITCDIVDSRSVLNRNKLQLKINDLTRHINRVYENQILTKFNITLGDEFQGVLLRFNHFLDLYMALKTEMFPYQLNVGIGIGTINTKIYKANSHKMDGPAFHFARDMVDRAKQKPGFFYVKTGNSYDEILNLLIEEINYTFLSLTPDQFKLLKIYVELNNQIQVSELLGVSQAYVSRILKQIDFTRIKKIFDGLEDLVNKALEY